MLTLFGVVAFAVSLTTPRPAAAGVLAQGTDTLRVVLVVDDTVAQRSLVHGALLGGEEASHTGTLFNTAVRLSVASRASFDTTASGAHAPSVYVVAGDTTVCSRVMLQGARTKVPVLDAGCALADRARPMIVYSLAPVALPATARGDSTRFELWHWSLERFGGEQLNERYRRRFAARMDSPAWTGWLALKIALDAALHAHAVTGPALLHQLADPRSRYDGQKGRPLRFAADSHRLVQPLYRVAGHGDAERVVAEVTP